MGHYWRGRGGGGSECKTIYLRWPHHPHIHFYGDINVNLTQCILLKIKTNIKLFFLPVPSCYNFTPPLGGPALRFGHHWFNLGSAGIPENQVSHTNVHSECSGSKLKAFQAKKKKKKSKHEWKNPDKVIFGLFLRSCFEVQPPCPFMCINNTGGKSADEIRRALQRLLSFRPRP